MDDSVRVRRPDADSAASVGGVMDIDLIFKIAAVGIIVSILNQVQHKPLCTIWILYNNRRNFFSMGKSISYNRRNWQILRNDVNQPLMCSHIDNALHLL